MSKRKLLIVDRKFHYEFLIRNLGLLLISFVLMLGLFKVWEKYRLKQGILLSPPTNQQVVDWAEKNNVPFDSKEFISQFIVQAKTYTVFDIVWLPLVIVLILNVVIMYVTNIYFSHRVMGPIYRLKTVLIKKLEGQQIRPIRFRKNDYFHDLAELVNMILFEDEESDEINAIIEDDIEDYLKEGEK